MKTCTGLAIGAALAATVAGTALAQDSRYGSWDQGDRHGDRTQQLVDDLRGLIDEADRARAADRRFLRDLRDLVARYDWPWRDRVIDADFTSRTPFDRGGWRVIDGRFNVDSRDGLIADAASVTSANSGATNGAATNGGATNGGGSGQQRDAGRDLAIALLGSLLNQKGGQQGGDSAPAAAPAPTTQPASARATAMVDASVPAAFAARLELRAIDREAADEIALIQSRSGYGYRLRIAPAAARGEPALELRRESPRGYAVIANSVSATALGDGRTHTIEWTRDSRGAMRVTVDGEPQLTASDAGLRDPFDRVEIAQDGGRSALRTLQIWGATAR